MISKGLAPEKLVVYMGYSSFKHMINYYRVAAAKDQIIKEIRNILWENYWGIKFINLIKFLLIVKK